MAFHISLGTRIRQSPFFDATVAEGVTHFSTYNRMFMPTAFGDPMAEYWRIIKGVSMWDVAVERQVEISGPDAARLAQALSARKIGSMQPGQGRYVPVCDGRGVLINDPILLKLADDRYWFSIADSDLLLWARAIAHERRLDVKVHEPDVAPLAVQGPKAGAVIEALFGTGMTTLKPFAFREAELEGIPLLVARSGWSKQGGFELYLRDGARGLKLWDLVKEAGQPHGIGPGAPNQMERVESGLLSWGADTDDETTPFEVRLERFVDTDAPDDVIGIKALRREKTDGPKRRQLGIRLGGTAPMQGTDRWYAVIAGERRIGTLTSLAWSPRLELNIGLCLVEAAAEPDAEVHILDRNDQPIPGVLSALPFL